MAKFNLSEWLGILPSFILLLFVVFVFIASGFQKILLIPLGIVIILLIFSGSYSFNKSLQEFGENNLSDNPKILELEKNHYALAWGFSSATGLAFLIPILNNLLENPFMVFFGFTLMIIGNFIHYFFYYPRYNVLHRLAKITKKNLK